MQEGTEPCVPGYGANCNINCQKYYVKKKLRYRVVIPHDKPSENRHICTKQT